MDGELTAPRFTRAQLVGACIMSALGGCRSNTPPSLFVLTLDAWRADWPTATAPELARWTAEGRHYSRAYTVAPLTLPAHVSLWSGHLPWSHGVRTQAPAATQRVSFALLDALGAAGYQRAAFVSTAVLRPPAAGLAAAFDAYDAPKLAEREAEATVALARQWLARVPARQPVVLWLHLFELHYPYLPEGVHWRDCPEEVRGAVMERVRTAPLGLKAGAEEPAALAGCLANLYWSELAAVDRELPALRRAMQGRTWLWVITGDHGECLGEEGVWARHGNTLLECAVRVPLYVGGLPSFTPASADDRLASLTDVAPTVAAALGVAIGSGEGFDLAAAPAVARRAVFEAAGLRLAGQERPLLGAWLDDEKVVWGRSPPLLRAWRRQLTAAPAEVEPAALKPATRVLAERLRTANWPPAAEARGPPAEQSESLRALGYVQ